MESVFYGFENDNIMKDKLNRLDAILKELQMDEYLNEDSLPKIGEARGLVNELVKNCSIPDVSQQRELFDAILDFTEDLPMCSEDYNRDTLYKRYIAENCG